MKNPDASSETPVVSVAPRASSTTSSVQPTSRLRLVVISGVVLILALGAFLVWRAQSRINRVALASSAQPVTVVKAQGVEFRPVRTYIGLLEPWQSAKLGPQFISAYVSSVLVRPGAVVKKGDVLATLDCRHSTASTRAVAMQANAIDARQKALTDEAVRTKSLLDGGFVSANEVEQRVAQSVSEQAQLEAGKAQLARSTLDVNDCILRAPFDGDVATRDIDPGAFVHPGTELVSVVDRSVVRVTAEAPEVDFPVVEPATEVKMRFLATGQDLTGVIARRAPAADMGTRTVHFEIDVPDASRTLPVGTTAELTIEVGEPRAASAIPLAAAVLRNGKATLFVVDGDVAHTRQVPLLGEREGLLYLDPSLKPGTPVVLEGRALLQDGEKVTVGAVQELAPQQPPASTKRPDVELTP
ncbi:MAG: efflux RND transporter periplasmic adaptor subunit [Myxococcaceae bacterium]